MSQNTVTQQENGAALINQQEMVSIMERVLLAGDLSKLQPEDRVKYYNATCQSLKLNPLTKPFDYITLPDKKNGSSKTVLYATKNCTEQLRSIRNISITKLEVQVNNSLLTITASGTDSDGRNDIATAAIWIGTTNGDMKGDDLANAYMKCETKAKRRLTLSLCGLGMMDESEIETIKSEGIYNNHSHIDDDPVKTTLAKHIWSINTSKDMELLKESFAEGWKDLKKFEARARGKEALTELNQIYLKKKAEFETMVNENEATLSDSK